MKCLLFLLLPAALPAAYQYYYTDALTSLNAARWQQNGTVSFTSAGLTTTDQYGGSLIATDANLPPSSPASYEISTTLNIAASGSVFVHYHRASLDAKASPQANGQYYSVEMQPTVSGAHCTLALTMWKRAASGAATILGSTTAPCHNGMVVRSWRNADRTHVYVDGILYLAVAGDNDFATGRPGIGIFGTQTGNTISLVKLGPTEFLPPGAVDVSSIAVSTTANSVEMQWRPAADDANGIGVWAYGVYRDGANVASAQDPQAIDETVSPGTTYQYQIQACDFYLNCGPLSGFTVTTPPAGSTDPRRVGVRPTGTYWGAGGEQIDMRSGNLNFTLPLFKAMGRGSWSVGFSLSYNSQLWRHESGRSWKLGADVGYGFGWRLMAGSLFPCWNSLWSLDHYLFTDATGAEYRLDVNTNGIWTSRESVYVSYDSNNQRLYFPDGSFWHMGVESAGAEPDAGTLYPDLMQDTNGNQVRIVYLAGSGVPWENSSARIDYVEDVRAPAPLFNHRPIWASYLFNYNTDATPHLTGIQSFISVGEGYNFTYAFNQSLTSPWGDSFGSTAALTAVANLIPQSHSFEYTPGTWEMTRAVLLYGGDLRWAYRDFTYLGNRTLREVQYRYLTHSAGATPVTYTLLRNDAADANSSAHTWGALFDPSGPYKIWWFAANGENTAYEGRTAAGGTLRNDAFIWTQDSLGNRYVGATITTLENGQQTMVQATRDNYGNLTQTRMYNYGSFSAPARTYNNTYSAGYAACSTYLICNLLGGTTVTDGTTTKSLEGRGYDGLQLGARDTTLRLYDWSMYWNSVSVRGNLTYRWVPGRTTTYTYYTTGAVASTTDSAAGSASVTPTLNEAAPSLVTPNGNTNLNVSLGYSPFMDLSSVTGPNGAAAGIGYDIYGRVQSRGSTAFGASYLSYSGNQVTEGKNGHWTKTTLDGLGRAVRVERGYGTTVVSTQDTEYAPCACSPLGKVSRVSQPYAPGGTVYWTTYAYDGLGRTTSVTLPDGSITTYAYSGNTTTVTDPAGKWKTYTNDVFGNLVQVTEPNPNGGANYQTYYTYNLRNQLTQVQMPRDSSTQTRTFTYNDEGQLTQSVNPETGTVTYTYNTDKLLASRTDNRGARVEYSYDAYKRLIQIRRFPAGSSEDLCQRVDYTYDTNAIDANFTQNGWGRRTTESFNAGCAAGLDRRFIYMYSYNQGGQVIKKALRRPMDIPEPPADIVLQYTYNSEGQVATMTYPTIFAPYNIGDETYTYGYDSMGRPNSLTMQLPAGGGGTIVNTIVYGPADEIRQLGTVTRDFNSLLQLTREGNSFGSIYYAYTAGQNNGRITSKTTTTSGEQVVYQYDALNRLVRAETAGAQWGNAYSYDGFGNLLSSTVTKGTAPYFSFTADPASNRISGRGYDASGNMVRSPNWSGDAAYDVESRLTYMPASSLDGTYYGYDPDNHRVWVREPNGGEDIYLYGLNGRPIARIFGRYEYVYIGNRLVFKKIPASPFGVMEVNAYEDRLGSVGTFFPYGVEPAPSTTEDIKFATYYRDKTGLDYANQRYYDSRMGRFLTADPYKANTGGPGDPADPSSWNRYAYVEGDPINWRDPSGLSRQDIVDFSNCMKGTGPCPDSDYANDGPDHSDGPSGPPPGGGGGGGGPSNAQVVANASMRASDRIFKPDCAGLFLSPEANTPEQRKLLSGQLQYAQDGGRIRVIDQSALPAGTGPNVPAFTTGTWGLIYVVSGGAFFTGTLNGNPLGGPFQGLAFAETQELMIIHEFLHWEGIGPDNAGQTYRLPNGVTVTGSQGISAEVRSKCF